MKRSEAEEAQKSSLLISDWSREVAEQFTNRVRFLSSSCHHQDLYSSELAVAICIRKMVEWHLRVFGDGMTLWADSIDSLCRNTRAIDLLFRLERSEPFVPWYDN